MGNSAYVLMTLLALLMITSNGSSEEKIYQWTDEKGKVHFSDRPPEKNMSKEGASKLKEARNVDVQHEKLPVLQTNKDTLLWIVVKDNWMGDSAKSPRKEIGRYYFGDDCVSPTSIKLGDFIANNKQYFLVPLDFEMSSIVQEEFKLSKVKTSRSSEHSLSENLNRNAGLVLEMNILDYRLELCAPTKFSNHFGKHGTKSFSPSKWASHYFTKQKSSIVIEWRLYDNKAKKPLYTLKTKGQYSQWKTVEKTSYGLLPSVRQATQTLLRSPEFFKVFEEASVSSGFLSDEKGIFDRLWSAFQPDQAEPILMAKLAGVLAEANQLKIMVTVFYMENLRWPETHDILSDKHRMTIANKNSIDSVYLKEGGVINFELGGAFGVNSRLQLVPSEENGTIYWECVTNFESKPAELHSCNNR